VAKALHLVDVETGEIEEESPVPLPPMQLKIYNAVRTSRYGLTAMQLVSRVYADRIDGGPEWAQTSVNVQIMNLNKRLSVIGQRVKANARGGQGARYTLHVV